MKFFIIIAILVSPFISKAQKVKYVDNAMEKGKAIDNHKTGIWEYYDDSVLVMKIDYTTGKLKYLRPDTTKYAVKTEEGWKMMQLDVYPHYLGSKNEITAIFAQNLRYPHQAHRRGITGTVLLGFEVNKQGHVQNVKILKDVKGYFGKYVLKAFKEIPDFWLTAQKGNKKYVSRFILPIQFKIGDYKRKGIKYKKFSKKEIKKLNEIKAKYHPSSYLDTIVISTIRI